MSSLYNYSVLIFWCYFQQDIAQYHKAQIISDWFLEHDNEFTLLKWPPQLPDLRFSMGFRSDEFAGQSSSLLVKLSKVFESPLLDSKAIPVAWAPFPTQILHFSQLCIQYALYSISWTATPFSNDPLWLTLFMKGVNDRLLDHCQVSILPHYCGFKEQEIHGIYTVWMVINLN